MRERYSQGPISRSALMLAFRAEVPEPGPRVVIPDYRPVGDVCCAYFRVLFGMRLDCHGLIEGTGHYHVPDLVVGFTDAWRSHACGPREPPRIHPRSLAAARQQLTLELTGEAVAAVGVGGALEEVGVGDGVRTAHGLGAVDVPADDCVAAGVGHSARGRAGSPRTDGAHGGNTNRT